MGDSQTSRRKWMLTAQRVREKAVAQVVQARRVMMSGQYQDYWIGYREASESILATIESAEKEAIKEAAEKKAKARVDIDNVAV